MPYCQPRHGRQLRKDTADDAAEERTERGAPRLYTICVPHPHGGSRREPVTITPNAIWGEARAGHTQHVGDMRSPYTTCFELLFQQHFLSI